MKERNKVLVLGGVIIDRYLVVEDYPERGQDISVQDTFEKVGGCTVNVANTLKNLGAEPYIVTSVGDDQAGNFIGHYLQENGYKMDCIRREKNQKTGFCFTIVDGTGERTFMTYKGCEGTFSSEIISDKLAQEIAYIYLTGYYLLEPPLNGGILDTLAGLKKSGSKLVFDPGPLVKEIENEVLLSVLKMSDILVPNSMEVEAIEAKLNLEPDFTRWCLNNGAQGVVIKSGSQGVEVWEQEQSYFQPSYKVKAIDTTGAGDSFAGGLIYALLNNYSLQEAMAIASACGALSTTFMGPHGKFNLGQVMEIVERREENTSC